jgi:FMN phosphatase YigB (HAD superfamily)
VFELGIAIVAMAIWELGRRLLLIIYRWQNRRRAIRRILSFTSEVVFAYSTVRIGGQLTVRESDAQVESELSRFATKGTNRDHEDFSIENPASDIVVIGSPRYNDKATLVQQYFDIPFQFVFADDEELPGQRRLSIITEFGEELTASPDHRGTARQVEVDYGILLVASLAQNRRLIWLAGIHGIGTIGVHEYLKREAAEIVSDLPKAVNAASVRLFRIIYEPASVRDRARIRSVELLGQSRSVGIRTVRKCQALVLDFGNVLMEFDRDRTYRAIARHINYHFIDVRQVVESSNLRERYEVGDLTTKEFCHQLRTLLNASVDQLPDSLLIEYWGDIFWKNTPIWSALTELRRNGICLVLLSNTNELHFQHVAQDYPELMSLFDARILSYEQRIAKPNHQIFERALDSIRKLRPGVDINQVAYVDDREDYVQAAQRCGMQGFVYRSYPHLVFWLRQHGVYVA